jgi:hypothetical protein
VADQLTFEACKAYINVIKLKNHKIKTKSSYSELHLPLKMYLKGENLLLDEDLSKYASRGIKPKKLHTSYYMTGTHS